MKKTIIYLGLALVAFSNVSMASTENAVSTSKIELVNEYTNATPLAAAICKGDVEAVKKFIEYGIDVNEKSNGMTPLMIAARYNQVEIIKMLLDNGAELKVTDAKGFNALKYAELSNAQDAYAVLKKAQEA